MPKVDMQVDVTERSLIRAALYAREHALAPAADPNNPWKSDDAVRELQAIAALIHRIRLADAEEASFDPILLANVSAEEE
jgi:hypothetical protein